MDTRTLLDWTTQGALPPQHLEQALQLAKARPDQTQTRFFLDRLLLISSVLCACSAVIFFFAYNWDAMSRLHKFTLAQVVLVLPLLALLRYPLQHWLAQSAMFASSLLLGAWLALIGQTYQTGADTYELFLLWAVLLIPWAWLARSLAIASLIVLLMNLSAVLAFATYAQLSIDLRYELLFGMNLLFWLPLAKISWSTSNKFWLFANASLVGWLLVLATIWSLNGIHQLYGWDKPSHWLGTLVWLGWMSSLFIVYAKFSFQRQILTLWLTCLPLWLMGLMFKIIPNQDYFLWFLLQGGLVMAIAIGGFHWLKPREAA